MGGFDAGNGEDFAFGHSVGIFVEEIESVFEVGVALGLEGLVGGLFGVGVGLQVFDGLESFFAFGLELEPHMFYSV